VYRRAGLDKPPAGFEQQFLGRASHSVLTLPSNLSRLQAEYKIQQCN